MARNFNIDGTYDQSKQGLLCGSVGKESSCNVGDLGLIIGLGKERHSSILAWRIPWTV